MTAPVGWIASRFGKRRFILVAVAGFTVTSALCGLAQNLDQIIVFRLLQGAFGAALGPLSQTIMMDMFPPESRGSVMGIWGMGVMLGPILGPTLGGYLTDAFSWRWVFYINVPVGIAAVADLWLFYRDPGRDRSLVFDWLGFSLLALGLGALQLMLDRGTHNDWFNSTEIVIEGVARAARSVPVRGAHGDGREAVHPARDLQGPQLHSATLLMFVTGGLLVSSSALLAPYLQTLGGYSVTDAGLLMVPRGIGTMLAMSMVGRIAMRFDRAQGHHARRGRVVRDDVRDVALDAGGDRADDGLGRLHPGLRHGIHLRADESRRVLDDLGRNPHRCLRDHEPAAQHRRGIQRFVDDGSADEQHADRARAGRRSTSIRSIVRSSVNAPAMMWNPQMPFGLASIDGVISRAALQIAYANDFLFLFYTSIPAVLLVWLMRRPQLPGAAPPKREDAHLPD